MKWKLKLIFLVIIRFFGSRKKPNKNESVHHFGLFEDRSFLRLFLRSFVCLFVRLFVCLFEDRSFVRLFVRLFVCSFVRLFVCSFVCSFARLLVFSFVRLFVYLFVCSFVCSSVRSFYLFGILNLRWWRIPVIPKTGTSLPLHLALVIPGRKFVSRFQFNFF